MTMSMFSVREKFKCTHFNYSMMSMFLFFVILNVHVREISAKELQKKNLVTDSLNIRMC